MAKKVKTIASRGRKAKMPSRISPMLCTLTKEVIQSEEYLYEVKWDGYRIISYAKGKNVRMDSRSGLDYTDKYPPIVKAIQQLKHDVILDGEVVVFNKEGLPDFDALQLYNGHDHPITYCVFDILWIDGYVLKELPLIERKEILEGLLANNAIIRFSEHFEDGKALYQSMLDRNLEGIVAKKKNSEYIEGNRGSNWLKTPTRKRQEFVIGGWAESDKSRAFRSLLFGAYDGKQLKWIGRSGGGYKENEMPGILKQLQALEVTESPFVNRVLDTKGAVIHWVKPELVANFEFATWTKSGRIRKPATFLGFRKDKKAKQVVLEVPKEIRESDTEQLIEDIAPDKKSSTGRTPQKTTAGNRKLSTSAKSNWPEVEKQNHEDKGAFQIDDCSIDLFNVDRELWKGVSKADLITYYHNVHEYILPHVKDRALSLHVKLNGPQAPGLYIKDMEGRQPDCAQIFSDRRRHVGAGKRKVIDYLICNNEATLLWLINLGCIDVNPWNARMQTPDKPDYIVIDLDPTEDKLSVKGLQRLQNTAIAAKDYCDENKLKAFVKTSGKTGMHFLIPCSGFTCPEARSLGEQICRDIHELVPEEATININKSGRGNKVFIDFSQNDYADTIAAPYCVRPYHIPLVSTPLAWKEVNSKLDPRTFRMNKTISRLEKVGDLFENISDKKLITANNKVLSRM
ncbi:DNA ligase D [Niastella sp. OAS944]|uniref:DNA ligase D n=1 Tax=Niastella sp. OAS944 TaxID=2664089 RepID=UPI0034948FBF|nr:bifunctional non-homologous end joining protein LigD [Chitinophagaceae bacterium OAS944]